MRYYNKERLIVNCISKLLYLEAGSSCSYDVMIMIINNSNSNNK